MGAPPRDAWSRMERLAGGFDQCFLRQVEPIRTLSSSSQWVEIWHTDFAFKDLVIDLVQDSQEVVRQ